MSSDNIFNVCTCGQYTDPTICAVHGIGRTPEWRENLSNLPASIDPRDARIATLEAQLAQAGDVGEWWATQCAALQARIEEAFKAGYHCRWHKDQGSYCFDPLMSPGDSNGAFASWLESESST